VKYYFADSLRYKRGLSSHKLEDRISEYNRIGTGAGTSPVFGKEARTGTVAGAGAATGKEQEQEQEQEQ